MLRASQVFKAAARAQGVTGKFSSKVIDKGWSRFANAAKSIQTDKSYVKVGLLGPKAAKKRKDPPSRRIEDPHAVDFAKAQAAINPVLLALLAHAGRRHKAKKGSQPTNVQVAIWNEFGTTGQPARPFVRPSVAAKRLEYIGLLALFVKAHVMTGRRTYVQTLALIGQRAAADMKNYVTQGPQIPPPNAPAYWAEKLHRGYWKHVKRNESRARRGLPVVHGPVPPPRTLVDTGVMVNAITYAVITRSTGDGGS